MVLTFDPVPTGGDTICPHCGGAHGAAPGVTTRPLTDTQVIVLDTLRMMVVGRALVVLPVDDELRVAATRVLVSLDLQWGDFVELASR